MMRFHPQHIKIAKYIAEEVSRQQDGPMAVYYMLSAWNEAMGLAEQLKRDHVEPHEAVTPQLVETWGINVHPLKNVTGWRRVNLSHPPDACKWENIPIAIEEWCASVNEQKWLPAEAYLYFQKIHPFRDGNGRVGKLLYNWLLGSLDDPQMPPDFFGAGVP